LFWISISLFGGLSDGGLIVWLQRQTPGVLMIIKEEDCEDSFGVLIWGV
jgi:hypothetical protein